MTRARGSVWGIVPPFLYPRVFAAVACAVWQLKHARDALRQRSDMCPQQHETGVHPKQRNSIGRHGRQHKSGPPVVHLINGTRSTAVVRSERD